MSIQDSASIKRIFINAEFEIILHADQTFVHFYPKKEYVLSPTGATCVGGKINLNDNRG
jgi:hypothetical protein